MKTVYTAAISVVKCLDHIRRLFYSGLMTVQLKILNILYTPVNTHTQKNF